MTDPSTNSTPTAASLLRAVSRAQKAHDYTGALQQVVAALDHHPDDLPLQLRKAVVLRQLQRNDEGISHLQTLLKQRPRNLAIKHTLAVSYRVAGDYDASLELIHAVLKQQPDHRGALIAVIDIANSQQKFADALRHVDRATSVYPDDLSVQIKQAVALRGLRRHDEGIALLVSLYAQNPHDLTVMQALATSYRAAGDNEASLALTDAILAQHPNHPAALIAKIEGASRQQDHDTLSDFAANRLPDLMESGDAAHNNLGAMIGAIILAGLPARLSETIFNEIATWLVAHRQEIPSPLLWQIYERADFSGKDALVDSFLDELFSRDTLGLKESKQILAKAFQLQLAHWKEIGRVLLAKQSPANHPQFELEYRALTVGASRALAQRDRHRGGQRKADEAVLVSRLLRQAGKQRVAVRYLHKVFHHHPDNMQVFREYVTTALASGAPQRVAKARERLQSSAPQGQLAIAMCCIEMNDLEQARILLEGITQPQIRLASRTVYINVLIGLNDIAAAERTIQEMQAAQSHKNFIHFNASLHGLLFTDAKMASKTGPDQTSSSSITPAVRTISDWRNDQAPKSAEAQKVPRKIVQYWDQAPPPADIAEIMQTWEAAPDCDYHLFSRSKALRFINDRIGADWAKAFLMARSPTEQSDFFRLCFLMLEGGLYADSDDRLICDVDSLFAQAVGLTVTLEPFGKIGNNIIMAPAKHPALVWAAVSAKTSLLQRDNDSTWSKAGPGLLTRAVARYIQQCTLDSSQASLTIIERYKIGRYIQYHTPLPYKKSKRYWNAQHLAGQLKGLSNKFEGMLRQ